MSARERHLRRGTVPMAPALLPSLPLSPVGVASPDDAEELVEFLLRIRQELGGGIVEWDLVAAMADALSRREGGVAFIVRGARDGIEGSLGLCFNRRLLSRNYFLTIVWNHVLPSARKTGHAKSMLIEACKFSDRVGCPLWHEEMSPTHDAPRVRLATRHLLPTGFVFTHIPASSQDAA